MARPIDKARTLAAVLSCLLAFPSCRADDPSPKIWPEQFHAQICQVGADGTKAVVDLWYDWPNGRNLNIIQHQLSYKLYDFEWTNGTSFYYNEDSGTCQTIIFPVGILSPDWLAFATYLGVEELDGFSCNVWEKEDFITYYEDRKTGIPVGWLFRTNGMFMHVITFDVGAVLDDAHWQSSPSCFMNGVDTQIASDLTPLRLGRQRWNEPWKRWSATASTERPT